VFPVVIGLVADLSATVERDVDIAILLVDGRLERLRSRQVRLPVSISQRGIPARPLLGAQAASELTIEPRDLGLTLDLHPELTVSGVGPGGGGTVAREVQGVQSLE